MMLPRALSNTPLYFSLSFFLFVEEIFTYVHYQVSTLCLSHFHPLDQICFTFSLMANWRCHFNRVFYFSLGWWQTSQSGFFISLTRFFLIKEAYCFCASFLEIAHAIVDLNFYFKCCDHQQLHRSYAMIFIGFHEPTEMAIFILWRKILLE